MAGARHGRCELTRHGMTGESMGTAWARHGICELPFTLLLLRARHRRKMTGARHGRGTAWERHGMCELAFIGSFGTETIVVSRRPFILRCYFHLLYRITVA
jgi:hypothetical protein